jgi:ribonuclease HI
MKQREQIRIFVDGSGADPNGLAGFAWFREGQKPHAEWGHGWTNNEAEYRAVLSAITNLQRGAAATVFCDSALVIQQLRGEYDVREPRLCDLHAEVQKLIAKNDLQVAWTWIPRKDNRADRLLRQKPRGTRQSPCVQKQIDGPKSQAKAR